MKKQKKLSGFTLVELLVVLAIIGLLAAISIPAILNLQKASRNTTRAKQLSAVRDAMADYYSRYSDEPDIFASSDCSGIPSASSRLYIAKDADSCSRRIEVILTNEFKLTQATNNTCQPSIDKTIYFIKTPDAGTISLCREGGGEEELNYRQGNELDGKEIN